MGKIKGVDVKVKIGTAFVGGQRGATLNRSSETIDETTKDSAGWKENGAGFKEWGVDCDGLIPVDDTAYEALEDAFENGTPVELEVAEPNGKKYNGSALITDFPLEYPYDDDATYSMTFAGTGALTKTAAPAE